MYYELFNEFAFIVIVQHLTLFTPFVVDQKLSYLTGWFYIGLIGVLIAMNVIYFGLVVLKGALRRWHIHKLIKRV